MNTLQTTVTNLGDTLAGVILNIVSFLPSILIALLLVVLGWVIGGILGRAVAHLVSMLKVDSALQKAGIASFYSSVGTKVSVARALGGLVKWAIIIAFVIAATEQVGLHAFSNFLYAILSYIPNVFVAGLILIATFLLADFMWHFFAGSSQAVGVRNTMAAGVAKYAIIVVGVVTALAQLKIATGFMEMLFAGLVGSVALALGLAFGLGGREAAARAIEKIEQNF